MRTIRPELIRAAANPSRAASHRVATVLFSVLILAATVRASVAQDVYTVQPQKLSDEKAIFATVETRRSVPARTRIGGTVAELKVREGDKVETGQTIATVGDDKLALQMKSLDAQIAGLQAQQDQAQIDLNRAEELFAKNIVPRTRLDEARTAANVANNALRARTAERSVIAQQLSEGNVLAPASGRVLKVPLTTGTVVMPGDPVAQIAEANFVLRLRVPESQARGLKSGDTVRVDASDIGARGPVFGTITLVYPQIEDGRVVADAKVEGLSDYYVGKRVRVWIAAGERSAFVIPVRAIQTRFGVDYVRLRTGQAAQDVPVQRGRPAPRPDMTDGIEILSGLKAGDVLVLQ